MQRDCIHPCTHVTPQNVASHITCTMMIKLVFFDLPIHSWGVFWGVLENKNAQGPGPMRPEVWAQNE